MDEKNNTVFRPDFAKMTADLAAMPEAPAAPGPETYGRKGSAFVPPGEAPVLPPLPPLPAEYLVNAKVAPIAGKAAEAVARGYLGVVAEIREAADKYYAHVSRAADALIHEAENLRQTAAQDRTRYLDIADVYETRAEEIFGEIQETGVVMTQARDLIAGINDLIKSN